VARLEIVEGADQSGPVGEELPTALAVRVLDVAGSPIEGQVVNFRVTLGGGSVFAGVSLSNADGIARERWTLGPVAGPQELEARAVDSATGDAIVFETFRCTAVPGAPARIDVEGDAQAVVAGGTFAVPPALRVVDPYGNAVPGVTVQLTLAEGAGTLVAPIATTDATGRAFPAWDLGTVAGPQRLAAAVAGLPQVTIEAVVSPGDPATLALASGGAQSGTVDEVLAAPLTFVLRDAFGNAIPDRTVQFAASEDGSASPSAATTDAEGVVSTSWRLATVAGEQGIGATVLTHPGVSTSATASASPGAPAEVALLGGNDQQATVATILPLPIELRVLDRFGNAVSGAALTIAVSAGALVEADAATGAGGQASFRWSLGTVAGTQTASVSVTASAVPAASITAHAVAGPPASVALTPASGGSAAVGRPLSMDADVRDAYGNAVAGVAVDLLPEAGGGFVRPSPTVVTGSDGKAAWRWYMGFRAGANELRVTAGDASALASATGTASGGTCEVLGGPGQTGAPGATLPEQLVVRITDAYGNPSPGSPVSFHRVSGSTSLQATTDADGIVRFDWMLGPSVGVQEFFVGMACATTVRATAALGPPPGISVTAPLDGEVFFGTIPVTAACVDADGCVVSAAIGDPDRFTWSGAADGSAVSGTFVGGAAYHDLSVQVVFTATDGAGNSSRVTRTVFVLDAGAPLAPEERVDGLVVDRRDTRVLYRVRPSGSLRVRELSSGLEADVASSDGADVAFLVDSGVAFRRHAPGACELAYWDGEVTSSLGACAEGTAFDAAGDHVVYAPLALQGGRTRLVRRHLGSGTTLTILEGDPWERPHLLADGTVACVGNADREAWLLTGDVEARVSSSAAERAWVTSPRTNGTAVVFRTFDPQDPWRSTGASFRAGAAGDELLWEGAAWADVSGAWTYWIGPDGLYARGPSGTDLALGGAAIGAVRAVSDDGRAVVELTGATARLGGTGWAGIMTGTSGTIRWLDGAFLLQLGDGVFVTPF
jgi:hypothetical protein